MAPGGASGRLPESPSPDCFSDQALPMWLQQGADNRCLPLSKRQRNVTLGLKLVNLKSQSKSINETIFETRLD